MDLNHIALTASEVAGLYPSSLIAEEPAGKNATDQEMLPEERGAGRETGNLQPFKSLGDNQKNILVVVKSPGDVYLPDHELSFLAGILGACRLSLADVAIVNLLNHPETSYKELTAFFKSRIVLLFDTAPADIGLPVGFPPYQIQAFAGNSYLYSPSLKELENDRVEKSKLWVCLKRLFNL